MKSEPTTTNENTISITNSSGEDFIVLSAYEKPLHKESGHTLFENALTVFKTVEDKSIISNQETGVIRLDGNFTSKGEKVPSILYDLLFVKTKSLFPIASRVVMKDEDDSITITKEEKEQMLLARKFCMHVFASPTSKLAEGFNKALRSNSLAKKPENLEKAAAKINDFSAVNTFLKDSKSYKTLNFSAIQVELSYLKSYVSPWVRNKETSTFYLYTYTASSKGLKNSTLVGTLNLTKTKFPMPTFELKNGYKITFTDEKTKKNISLKFDQGAFYTDKQEISIKLNPYFIKKSKLTNDSKDKVIIVGIVGKIEQEEILGSEIKLDLEKSPYEPGSFNAFIHPATFAGKFSLAMSIVGIAFAVQFTAGLTMAAYRLIKKSLGSKEPNAIESLDEKMNQMSDKMNKLLERQEVPAKDLQNIDATIENLKAEEIAVGRDEFLVNGLKSCKAMRSSIKTLARMTGVDSELENAAERLQETQHDLEQTFGKRIENLESGIEKMSQQIKSLQNSINSMQNEIKHRMVEEDLQQTKTIEKNFEKFEEVQKEIEKNMEDVKEGEGTGEEEVEIAEDFEIFSWLK